MLVTVVAGLIAGTLLGSIWGGLACALAAHLTWQLVVLFRVEWWVRHRSFADPPNIGGVWGEIVSQIVRLHRRKRFHKQRFVQLMRQLQSSTAALQPATAMASSVAAIHSTSQLRKSTLFRSRMRM